MLSFKENMPHETKSEVRGGNGPLDFEYIFGADALLGAGTQFQTITLPAGTSIGVHAHTDNFEIYYVLEGSGIINDSGEEKRLKKGDAEICHPGGTHGLANDTDKDLVILAVILNPVK